MAKKSLGKGLSDLLGELDEVYAKELGLDVSSVQELNIEEIKPNPFQPRKHFDKQALQELAESIKEYGLIQPIIVFQKGNSSGYTLIAGERRLRASKLAGFKNIKAVILEIDESKLRELALIENIQRENLNPIELARSYKDLIEEHHITQEKLSQLIHKSRSQIANTLRLLNLDENTQALIIEGKISQGHAKVLAGLDKNHEKIVVDTILGQKLNVRQTEKIAQKLKNKIPTLTEELKTEFSKLKEFLRSKNIECKVKDFQVVIYLDDVAKVQTLIKSFKI